MKTVAIVTPSFNQGKFIKETIYSVLAQEGDYALKYVIADGGSSDNTLKIINLIDRKIRQGEIKPCCKHFSLIYWSKKDKGQSDALNKGFAKANSDYCGWLNSDDVYANPRAIASMIGAFETHPNTSLVQGNMNFMDEYSKIIGASKINKIDNEQLQNMLPLILQYCFIQQPATLFTRKLWDRLEGVDSSYYYAMDWDLWIRAYRKGLKFIRLNAPVANFRVHSSGKTTNPSINYIEEHLRLYRKHHLFNRAYFSCLISYAFVNFKNKLHLMHNS